MWIDADAVDIAHVVTAADINDILSILLHYLNTQGTWLLW